MAIEKRKQNARKNNLYAKERIKGAFIGLYFGSGVNPRPTKMPPMYTPGEAKARFGNKKFNEIKRDYKLYDQHTQTKIIYDMLMRYGKITPELFKDFLLDLHRKHNVFEGNVYGPSTQKAVSALLEGRDIYKIETHGITCGSAMRALPIGMYFNDKPRELVENTVNACIVSHNTDVAIDAAIASNFTLAGLINGKDKFGAIQEGIKAAKKYHGKFGAPTKEPLIHERIALALKLLKGKSMMEAMEIIPEKIGVSWFARETIPGAYANYIVSKTPEDSALLAIRCGGDDETVPEIACAFMGAEKGPSIFVRKVIAKIEKKNRINIIKMADRIAKERSEGC